MSEEQKDRMGLIEYIAGKVAGFTVSYRPGQGRAVVRMWAAISNEQSQMIKERRWLPEAEALFYNGLADFRLVRWGTSVPARVPVRNVSASGFSEPPPEPQAVPLHVLLAQQAQAMAEAAPPEALVTKEIKPQIAPEYVMSGTGMAHKPDCSSAKRIKTPIEFFTMEDVISDPRFKKLHKCCKGAVV